MKTLIVCFSKFGNTRRIAEAMAEVLRQTGEARLAGLDRLTASDFEGMDLVVMGNPTHAFTVPAQVRAVLEALPQGILAGKSVAAFDTTVKLWPLRHLRASPRLLRQLVRLGGRPVACPRTFFVRMIGAQQPGEVDLLLEGQIEQAREWAGKILERAMHE